MNKDQFAYLNEEIESLRAERDRLKAELAELRGTAKRCRTCGRDSCWQHGAVEEKINAIKRMQGFTLTEVEQRLWELVALARR
jgi:uncharacterized coiled-coil DUF342 family protein